MSWHSRRHWQSRNIRVAQTVASGGSDNVKILDKPSTLTGQAKGTQAQIVVDGLCLAYVQETPSNGMVAVELKAGTGGTKIGPAITVSTTYTGTETAQLYDIEVKVGKNIDLYADFNNNLGVTADVVLCVEYHLEEAGTND